MTFLLQMYFWMLMFLKSWVSGEVFKQKEIWKKSSNLKIDVSQKREAFLSLSLFLFITFAMITKNNKKECICP